MIVTKVAACKQSRVGNGVSHHPQITLARSSGKSPPAPDEVVVLHLQRVDGERLMGASVALWDTRLGRTRTVFTGHGSFCGTGAGGCTVGLPQQ